MNEGPCRKRTSSLISSTSRLSDDEDFQDHSGVEIQVTGEDHVAAVEESVPNQHSKAAMVLPSLMAIAIGVGIVVQAGLNKRLGEVTGGAVRSAFFSFCVGSAALVAISFPGPRPDPFFWVDKRIFIWTKQPDHVVWWELLGGGSVGPIYLTLVIVCSSKLGFALLFVSVVAGQLSVSLLLDHIGFIGIQQRRVSPIRIVAAIITIGAAVMAAAERMSASTGDETPLYVFLGIVAGSCLPVQVAFNRSVARFLARNVRATFISFFVGTSILFIAFCLTFTTEDSALNANETEFWMWGGGFFGVALVSGGIILTPVLGVSAFFIFMIAGQLFSGLVLDSVGAFGVDAQDASFLRISGTVIAFLSAAVVVAK